jgi:methyl-accepting chemotaxis protein/methyl-accepting chemotaxis protein-1 (serine sensor receptor)
MTIRQKQLVLSACGLLPLVMITAISFWILERADPEKSDLAVASAALRNQMAADMMHDAIRADVLASLETSDSKQQEAITADLHEHTAKIEKEFRDNLAMAIPPDVRTSMERELGRLQAYGRLAGEMIALNRTNPAAARAKFPEFQESFNSLEVSMDKLDDLMVQTMNAAQQSLVRAVFAGKTTMLCTGGITFLILLGAGVRVSGAINRELSNGIKTLMQAASQIAASSGEIAGSSRSLAQGSSNQAASLEETSASMEEINSMARRNTEDSATAANLVTVAQDRFVDAHQNIEQMIDAMREINTQSNKISKIIHVIDEIAFQTNILALNASVEAARAGTAGMGFAVVAEEVRNLAQRCATAASDTSKLIEESISKSRGGKDKVDQVASIIHAITTDSTEIKKLVEQVNAGSNEQAGGISQIGKAVARMEQVTQSTAAAAEQGAAAAEVLSGQSERLRDIVGQLTLMVGKT